MGAWIEILKYEEGLVKTGVAPLVGAWIEIAYNRCVSTLERVAPLVGAWIEIGEGIAIPHAKTSLPLWERGLKSFCQSLT